MTLEERVARYLKIRTDENAVVADLQRQLDDRRTSAQQTIYSAYLAAFLTTDLTRNEVRGLPQFELEDGAIIRCEGKFWALSSNEDAPESDVVIRTTQRPGAFLAILDGSYR